MSKKTLPYTGWVLLPSFKPKEVEITRLIYGYRPATESGKSYSDLDVYQSLEQAIAEGHKRLDEQQARLDQQLVTLNKRRAALKAAK